MYVTPLPGESFDALLRRFTRGVQNAGILRDFRRKQRFTPAHEERREKIRRARRKLRRAQTSGAT